jgi:hypothetical protein
MDSFKEFLPRDKFDIERVQKLKELDKNNVIPLLPGLLEWIQDMNWPIAIEIADFLITFPEEITPLIKNVLSTNDGEWKYWCLSYLVRRIPLEYRKLFLNELNKIVESPSLEEKLEELDELAAEILEELKN